MRSKWGGGDGGCVEGVDGGWVERDEVDEEI